MNAYEAEQQMAISHWFTVVSSRDKIVSATLARRDSLDLGGQVVAHWSAVEAPDTFAQSIMRTAAQDIILRHGTTRYTVRVFRAGEVESCSRYSFRLDGRA